MSRYWPRQFDVFVSDPVAASLLNELPPADNITALVQLKEPLDALLVESLNTTRALLQRLELGVQAPPGQARWPCANFTCKRDGS